MSENTEPDKENTDTTENEDNKKYPNVYVSIAIASIIIASPFIIYNYFIKSSTPSSIEMPKMPEMPNMPNPFATTEIESKLTSIQDAMSKMENKMDEVDKKVTDLSTKPEPSSVAVIPAPVPEDKGGIFGNIGDMFGTAAPAPVAPAPVAPAPVPATIEDTSTTTSTIETPTLNPNPIKEDQTSSVFDLFSSSNGAVPQPALPQPIVEQHDATNPVIANTPEINNELNKDANIDPFKESSEPDFKLTPSIGEEENIDQPTHQLLAPPPQFGQPMGQPMGQPIKEPIKEQMGQPPGTTGGKTRKRRKYRKRKSKKVNIPVV